MSADGGPCTTLTTFNTGLMSNVLLYKERLPRIRRALRRHEADVLCLQEMYLPENVRGVRRSLRRSHPHVAVAPTNAPPPCSRHDVKYHRSALIPCFVSKGCALQPTTEGKLLCLVSQCAAVLARPAYSADCFTCFIYTIDVASGNLDISPTCRRRGFNPTGLMLLSRRPLSDVTTRRYHGNSVRMTFPTGYVSAKIPDLGTVVCTHLTVSEVPHNFEYVLTHANTTVQNMVEIQQLVSDFDLHHDSSSSSSYSSVLLGDLNVGPEKAPDNFATLLAAGWRDVYTEQDGRCTFCMDENPLLSTRAHSLGYETSVIDHVMPRGVNLTVTSARRVLDPENVALSDHYGVEVVVCRDDGS